MDLLEMLKEEIKRLASEESLNVNKLNDYTRIYEKLKLYEVSQVGEIVEMPSFYELSGGNNIGIARPRQDNMGVIVDIFKEAIMAQYGSKDKEFQEIKEYISWVQFFRLSKIEYEVDSNVLVTIDNLVKKLVERLINLMEKKLEKHGATTEKIVEEEKK